jgi:O-antigen/teichoic acid export membrane protein
MEETAVRGVPWALVTYATTRLTTVVTTVVLAHLLAPADFGILALALVATGAFSALGELGLGSTLVLRQDFDRRAQATVLSMMLITGTVAAAVLAGAAPLMADVFGEPRLSGVLAVLACTLVVNSVASFYEPILLRELEFRKRFVTYAGQSGAYAVTALGLAALGAGIWSLALAHLGATAVRAVALLRVTPYRVRPGFDRDVARDAFATGRGFMAQGTIAFLRQNTDYLVIGRMLGAHPLGFYSMAYRLAELPTWAVADPLARVTFPSFARMRSRGEDVGDDFLAALRLVALVTVPFGLALSAASAPFTAAVLGPRWAPMVGPLTVLGLWGAIRPVHLTLGWFVNSIGAAGMSARVSAVTVAALVPSGVLAAHYGGVVAVAWVVLGEAAVSAAALALIIQRREGPDIALQWQALRPLAVAAPVSWAGGRLMSEAFESAPPLAGLAAGAGVALLAFGAVVAVIAPDVLRDALRQGRRMRAPATATSTAPPSPS